MTPNPESLTDDDQILYALNRMTIGGYRHIPLTDLEGHLTGVISVKDIVEYLVSIVERAVLDNSQFE
jgi:CBS domain-containing protein